MVFDSKTDSCKGCGAQVSSFVTYCPFCGLDMVKAKVDVAGSAEPVAAAMPETVASEAKPEPQENLASLYNPPYVARDKSGIGVGPDEEEDVKEEVSFSQAKVAAREPILPPPAEPEAPTTSSQYEEREEKRDRGYLIPMSLMLIGSQFLTLALLIALFSRGGVLTIEWKTSTAFLFFLFSIPFLTFGFKWLGFLKRPDKKEGNSIGIDLSR